MIIPVNYSQTNIKQKTTLNSNQIPEYPTEIQSGKFNSICRSRTKCYATTNHFENTVILNLQLKISQSKVISLEIHKYDDVFVSIERFFRTNNITNKELVYPLAIKIFTGLASISNIINRKVSKLDEAYIKSMQKKWSENYGK